MKNMWEIFVLNMSELAEGENLELSIRTLNPGNQKFTYKRVRCQVCATADKFADELQVRMGRGQLSPARFSIKVIEDIERLPAKYR